MISVCIAGLSEPAIAAVNSAFQAAGMAAAKVAQRDAELSFASWHSRVYQALEQGQLTRQGDAAPVANGPPLGRLWEQLASDLFLSNLQTPVWGWADAKSLGLLDYWLSFDASTHFVLVATSPEQMLAEYLETRATSAKNLKKLQAAMPVDQLLAQWGQAHHAMLRFALRHPTRCLLVSADDLEPGTLIDAAKSTWPNALKALNAPAKQESDTGQGATRPSADPLLRYFAAQWCDSYPQAQTLHQEIASVAVAASKKNNDKQAKEAVLEGVLSTIALARKVPALVAQAKEAATQRDERIKAEAATKTELEKELQAKAQVQAALNDEKTQRKAADDERALLLTQLHQVQEDLERFYLNNKDLEKELKALNSAQRDLEAKAKSEAAAASALFAKERLALTQEKTKLVESREREAKAKAELQSKLELEAKAKSALAAENAKLEQEKAKLTEARDSLAQLRAEVQEKLNVAGQSRAEVVQEKIALSQKNKELIAARDAEIQRKAELQAKLDDELKAKTALAAENAKLTQEKAKLIEARDSLAQLRAEVQEKLNAAGRSRAEVVQEKIALSQKNKELIAAREAEIKLRSELQAKLEDELKAKTALAAENAKLEQEKAKLVEARAQTQEKLTEVGRSRAEVVQEKIALSQKNKELIAAREAEIKLRSELQAKLEDELKAKTALAAENAKLEQEKAKLVEARAQLQEKLNEASKARADAVQEKIALSQEQKEALSARDAEARAKTEALADLTKAQARVKAAEEESALMLAQLHKLQEEAERHEVRLKDVQTKSEQEKNKLIEARDMHVKARAEVQEKLNEAGKARAVMVQEKMALSQEKKEAIASREAAQARAKLAEQESALMLAQLHKLQEDAERYDLRIKDLQANLNQSTARFRRVASRQPDGIDWETVQTQPVSVEGRPALLCRATNVAVMGKEWKVLEFVAFIQDGTLSFKFAPSPDTTGPAPLTRLPRGLGSLAEFTARTGRETVGQPSAELLKDLSTSDWDLLRGLPRLLSVGLQFVRGAWPATAPGPTVWQAASKATLPALLRLPLALRFDVLKLQSAIATPTYEHLRLRLDPLSLGKKRIAGFEFRFACNLGQGGQFGTNARLEFFKGSGTPTFDQWTPNARDGNDERLDLVFVFPTSINLKDWSALSVNDRGLVLMLADQLPSMLSELGPGSVQITRPMAEWIGLGEQLRTFVRARLDVTGVQKQPGTLIDAVPGSAPQTGPVATVKPRTSRASSAVSEIKKPRAAAKSPTAAKKTAPSLQTTRATVKTPPARVRKKS